MIPSAAASASQHEGDGATIAGLQAAVTAGAARIRSVTMAYSQASLQASNLSQQISADKARLAQLEAQVGSTRSLLEQEAIASYTGDSATGVSGPAGFADPSVRAEYLQLAAGDLDDVVDQYTTQEQVVGSAENALVEQEQARQQALEATAQARSLALSQAKSEQSQLDALQSRMSLLAQETGEPPAAAGSQGLPVNNGVVTVVREIVATTPAPPPPPSPPPTTAGASTGSTTPYAGAGGVWRQLRDCESGGNYAENTGNGFYGAYQFSAATWTGLGYPGRPDLESPAMQDAAAAALQARSGWGQWPACSAALGL